MNTKNYVVNLSAYESLKFNKQGVDSFISYKESMLPASHEDSVIIGTGKDSHMQQSMLINFQEIIQQKNGAVIVKVQKFMSDKQKTTIELTLVRKRNTYEFISASEIR